MNANLIWFLVEAGFFLVIIAGTWILVDELIEIRKGDRKRRRDFDKVMRRNVGRGV